MARLPTGIYPMVYSFFDEHGSLRLDTYEIQIEAAIRSQAAGLAILGLGSEVSKLTPSERLEVLKFVSSNLSGRKPLLTTVYGNSPKEQIEFGKKAIQYGTDAILLQPPTKALTDGALIDFFSEIIAKLNIPIGIQNAPEFLGFGLSNPGIIKLADKHDNFVMAKLECSAVQLQTMVKDLKENAMIFNGRCGLELTDNLRAGAAGIIPGIETIDKTNKIFRLFNHGEVREADKLYSDLLPILCFIMQGIPHFLTYGKMLAAKRLGLAFGGFRKPALMPTEFGKQCIKRFADQLGKL